MHGEGKLHTNKPSSTCTLRCCAAAAAAVTKRRLLGSTKLQRCSILRRAGGMNGNTHTHVHERKNPHNRTLHIQEGARAHLPPQRGSRTELARHTDHRLTGAHASPAHLLNGSELSRRLSLTQDPGQRRTDRGLGPLITSAPNVPHPEKTLDSREAEPSPRTLDAVSIGVLLLLLLLVRLGGLRGTKKHRNETVRSSCLVWMLLCPLPPSHTPSPPSLYH